jgi:tyrosinase
MAVALLFRKEIDQLTNQELDDLRDGYEKMQGISDNRGFNYISGLHGIPGHYCVHYDNPPLFLPWHRAYLHEFEQYLQDQVPGATVPWWDWTSLTSHAIGVPAAFSTAQLAGGARNPLWSSRINQPQSNPPVVRDTRRFPMAPSSLPVQKTLDDLLDLNDFEDFSLQLRNGIHNQMHGWTGGSGIENGHLVPGDMGIVPLAAFDPIFYSHHCMIDRIWYLWQLRHGLHTLPQSIVGMVLPPFNVTVADVIDIHRLGYDYAVSAVVALGSTSP